MSDDAARASVIVPVPVERAFTVFTEGLPGWWPPEYTWAADDLAAIELEPRTGGRWLERDADGREAEWGEVLAWEPPHRAVLSWGIGPEREPEPDAARRSEIEARFSAQDERSTLVEVEHRHLARHGGEATAYADGMQGGWEHLLERFAAAAGGAE
jgi:uncharacterized protein YndB with AHSA1/START domain